MVERTPVYAEPDPANPGEAELVEVAAGESIKGTVPSSAVAANSVVGGDEAGAPTAIPVSPSALLGRLASGGLKSINLAGLMGILQALATSTGESNAGRLVKLGTTGKLSSTMLEQAIVDAEENQGKSIGFTVPLLGDHGHIFAGKGGESGEELLFRGVMTETPGTIIIHERATDVAVSVVLSDAEAAAADKLWSSQKIDTELTALDVAIAAVAAQTELSADTTPALGGDLDIGAFRLMVDVGGAKEAEVLSVDNTGASPVLSLLGLQAVLALLAGIQDGDQLRYNLAAGNFENFTPGVDLFEAIATTNESFVQSTPSPLKLASAAPVTASSNWEQAGVSGSTYTLSKYVGATAQRYRIKYEVSVAQTTPDESAEMAFVIRESSDGVAFTDIAGTARYARVFNRESISVETTKLMQPGEYIQLEVLHEAGGTGLVRSMAQACSVQIESLNDVETA